MSLPEIACVGLALLLSGASACSSPRSDPENDPDDAGVIFDAAVPDGSTPSTDGAVDPLCPAAIALEGLAWYGNQVRAEGALPGGEGQLASTACPGASGGETLYSIDLVARARVSLHVSTSYSSPATVYARRSCDADASDVACVKGTSKDLDLGELPAGPLYLVVDSVPSPPAEAGFQLDVTVTYVRDLGDPCDPAGVLDACTEGVCSSAGGAPHCAASQGPPVIDGIQFFALDPWRGQVGFRLRAHDPDGDVRRVYAITKDAFGHTLDAYIWSPFHSQPAGFVDLDAATVLSSGSEASIASTEITLTDSSGNQTIGRAPYVHLPQMKGLGEDCSARADVCAGELRCQDGHCADVSGAAEFCSQATASAPVVNLPGTTTAPVVLPVGRGHLTGRCADATSQGEALLRLHLSEPVTLAVSRPDGDQPINMYLRRDCNDPRSELACATYSPEFGGGGASFLLAPALPAGDYVLVVDGIAPTPGATIPVTLEAHPLVATGGTCTPYGFDRCVDESLCSVDTCVALGDVCSAPPALVPGTPVAAWVDDTTPLGPSGRPAVLFHLSLAQATDVVLSATSPGNMSAEATIRAACSPQAPYLADVSISGTTTSTRALAAGEYTIELMRSSNITQAVGYTLRATLRPLVAEGAACDTAVVLNRCEDGFLCDATGHCH